MRDARDNRFDSSSGLRGARQQARAGARRTSGAARGTSGVSGLLHGLDQRVLLAAGTVVVVLLVVLVAVVLPSACSGPSEDAESVPVNAGETAVSEGESEEPPADESATSTPSDQWRKGEMPFLYQIDPQYANATYSNGSFAKQGCGPTALSMVYIYLTGNTDKGPLEMAQFAVDNGYSTFKNGSSWTLVSEGASKLGLTSQALSADPTQLKEALEAGHPLICVMAPGTFTQVGHYIVVERLDSDGKAVVHDSNSVERSHQTWDLQLICDEADAVWSMGVA